MPEFYQESDTNIQTQNVNAPIQVSNTPKPDASTPLVSHDRPKSSIYGTSKEFPKNGLSYLAFFSLGSATFLDGLGLSLGIPILPTYVINHFHDTEIASGTLFSMYGWGSIVGFLLFFPMKAYGLTTKKIVILNTFLLLLSSILFSFSGWSLVMMDFARFLQGTTYVGIWAAGTSYSDDFYPKEKVGQKMSQLCAFFSVGVFIGPFIGSWLYTLGGNSVTFPFLFLGCSCVIPIAVQLMKLPELRTEQRLSLYEIYQQILTYNDRNLILGFGHSFFTGMSTMWVESTASLYFASRMNWGPRMAAYFFMTSSLAYVIGSSYSGQFTEKIGAIRAMLICNITCGFFIFVTSIPIQLCEWGILPDNNILVGLLEGVTFIGFGAGVIFQVPPGVSLLSDAVARIKMDSSVVFAFRSMFVALGYVGGPLIASAIAGKVGYPYGTIIGFALYTIFGIIAAIFGKAVEVNTEDRKSPSTSKSPIQYH